MKPKLAIVTGNPLKFRELSVFLNEYFDCEQHAIKDLLEIQGTPEEILAHKLDQAYTKLGIPVLVDDTSLHFEYLGGFPGPYIRGFFEHLKPWEMGEKFAGTRVSVSCRLGICHGSEDFTIGVGTINGDVVRPKTKDDQARDFDLFVQVDGTDKVMLEFSPDEKNKFSHRGLALKNLVTLLKETGKI